MCPFKNEPDCFNCPLPDCAANTKELSRQEKVTNERKLNNKEEAILADYIKENYVPIEVLQEIRAELTKHYVDPYNRNAFRYTTVSLLDVLDLIDKHIKEITNETDN